MDWHLQLVYLFPRTRSVDMFPKAIERTGRSKQTSFPLPARGMNYQFHFLVPRRDGMLLVPPKEGLYFGAV